jgi:hypothetical protein
VLVTAIIVVAGLATSVAALVLAGLLSGAPGSPGDGSPSAHRLWALAVLQAVVVALTLLACRRFGGRVGDVLALRKAPGWRAYAGALLTMAALQGLLAVVQHFLMRHDLLTDLRPFVGLVTGPNWPLAAAVLAIGAPLSEELLFRGFLFGALAQSRLGSAGAALISSAAWAALHAGYSLVGLAEVFTIGLLLSWLLWRTGSLRVTIFCHAVYNGAVLLGLLVADLPA